jgi:hypothetical protein
MNFGKLGTRNRSKVRNLQLYRFVLLLYSPNPLDLAAKKVLKDLSVYCAVHPLRNYSLHLLDSL